MRRHLDLEVLVKCDFFRGCLELPELSRPAEPLVLEPCEGRMQAVQRWNRPPHLSRENSQRGSSGRSYSGIGSSCAELRRVVMRTSGVLEFMEELESADT